MKKCKIKTVNGHNLIFMPDGTMIEGVKFTRVTCKVGEPAFAIIGLYVDLIAD